MSTYLRWPRTRTSRRPRSTSALPTSSRRAWGWRGTQPATARPRSTVRGGCSTTSRSCRSLRDSARPGRICSGSPSTAPTSGPSWTTRRVRPSVRARSSLETSRRSSRPTIRTFTRSTRRWRRRGCRNSSRALERELAPALSASARYIHKQIDRALEDVGTQSPGETEVAYLRIANPGFGVASEFYPGGGSSPLALPKAVRDYDAFEVALNRRLSGRWAARAAVHVEPAVGQLLRSRPVR